MPSPFVRLPRHCLAAVLPLVFVTSNLPAQVTILSQHRSVTASAQLLCAETPGPMIVKVSDDAGIFDESAAASRTGQEANEAGGFCIAPSDTSGSTASQTSSIASASIEAMGSASAGKGGAMENGNAIASSELSITLQVASTWRYQLSGTVDGLETVPGLFLPGNAEVTLRQGENVLQRFLPHAPSDIDGSGTSRDFSVTGTLEPGIYVLEASARAAAIGSLESGDQSSFRINLVPEPASLPMWILAATAAVLGRSSTRPTNHRRRP